MSSSRWIRGLFTFAAALVACASFAGADTNRWTSIGPTANGSIRIKSVALGPHGAIYVAGDLGIQRSTDGGSTWIPLLRVPNAYRDNRPFARYAAGIFVWVDPDAPTTLLAGPFAGRRLPEHGRGSHWTQLLYGSTFLSMAIAPSSSSTIYACVSISSEVPGLRLTFRSTDGGTTWTSLDSLGSAPGPGPRGRSALERRGLRRRGHVRPLGARHLSLHQRRRELDGAGRGPRRLLLQRRDRRSDRPDDPLRRRERHRDLPQRRWRERAGSPSTRGSPGSTSASITVDAQTPSVVYAGTSGGVFRSADFGAHWVSLGFHEATINAVVPDPASPSTVYAAMTNGLCRITLAPTVPCATGSETLCLGSGRFRVELTWRGKIESERGTGQAVPISDDTGYFWFFDAANVELVLKVLDGTAINGAFWVFYGALSDLEYVITVTDGVTGAIQSYISYAGDLRYAGNPNSRATRRPFPERARLRRARPAPRGDAGPRPRRPARAFRIPRRSAWRTAASRCASTGSRARSARPRARRPCR